MTPTTLSEPTRLNEPTLPEQLAPLDLSPERAAARAPASVSADPAAQSDADDIRFPFYSAAQLASGQFDTRYLIPGILAAGQPGGIFGAFKTLKTSITADLLISLASGTPFLGQFDVPEPGRALFLSGESGLAALQSIAGRICMARGLDLERLDNFELCPKLPQLDRDDDLQALRRVVHKKKPACLAIDPAYLAIRGEDARNLFAMGPLLRPLAELCDETGTAILIVHHCKRSRVTPGDPATLDNIAWAGFAEFSAQWLLLSRRRRFDPDLGRHELWLSAGGRAGHHGLWALDVDEFSPTDSKAPAPSAAPGANSGRIWKPSIRRVASAEIQSEKQQVEANDDRRMRRGSILFLRDCRRTVAALGTAPGPVSGNYLREVLGLNGQRMRRVLATLLDDEVVIVSQRVRGNRVEMGYTLSPAFRDSLPLKDKGSNELEPRMNET